MSGCSGVKVAADGSWERCGRETGWFCYAHIEQCRWLQTANRVVKDIPGHARMRLCIGMIKGNGRLCNNRVGGGPFNYCYLHGAQAPPSWILPKSDTKRQLQIHDPTHEKLKNILLYIVEECYVWKHGHRYGYEQSSHKSTPHSEGARASSGSHTNAQSGWSSESFSSGSHSHSSSRHTSNPSGSYSSESYSQSQFYSSNNRSFPFGSGYGYQRQSREEKYREQREQERKAEEKRRAQEKAERERRAHEERQRSEEEARRRRAFEDERRYGQGSRYFKTGTGANTSRTTRTTPRKQTSQAATDRYNTSLHSFDDKDNASFATNTVVFATFPWPVLFDPHYVEPNDVVEETVKQFFLTLPKTLDRNARKVLMRKSMIVWHPDRFRARRILSWIKDTSLRKLVEEKAEMISKIVNDVWHREFK
ncbi:hypothetical protein V5O48_000807 [Marasmius crinis-equi]|uniref:Uncharacterized protein n=1 Tax=Marasmius crinis-equi TaxID=585013 RepID=A0ABR3G0Q9_9AGAR